MRQPDSGGLVVDAEVRRGGFTLEVSLAAAPGQVLGLLGPNGAGKSTLLSAVAGLTPLSAGRITLAGAVFALDVGVPGPPARPFGGNFVLLGTHLLTANGGELHLASQPWGLGGPGLFFPP